MAIDLETAKELVQGFIALDPDWAEAVVKWMKISGGWGPAGVNTQVLANLEEATGCQSEWRDKLRRKYSTWIDVEGEMDELAKNPLLDQIAIAMADQVKRAENIPSEIMIYVWPWIMFEHHLKQVFFCFIEEALKEGIEWPAQGPDKKQVYLN